MRAVRVLLAVLCLLPGAALAAGRAKVTLPAWRPLTLACVMDASRANGIPLAALLGILATEGGSMGEALGNRNGSWDLGCFQVNTVHLNELAALGMSPNAVLRDGPTNAFAAAWLLRKEYQRAGNLWQAVGAYHSRTPHLRDAYIRRVRDNLKKLRREGLSILPLRLDAWENRQ